MGAAERITAALPDTPTAQSRPGRRTFAVGASLLREGVAGRGELTQTRPRVVREYPPCIKGVREDRCIQLYERGMRRAYARWLAEHGVTPRDRHAAARAYPPCRSRSDDRCQQRAARNRVRTARAATPDGT